MERGTGTFIIAEIGINHTGDLDIAKKLIKGAVMAGTDAVKFQKRTIDLVYSQEFLESPRESPWGTTQRDQKEGLEFGKEAYDEIAAYCRVMGIPWFASAWDSNSQLFLEKYDLDFNKIASPMLTNIELLQMVAKEGKYTFISTGMSTIAEIETAVRIFMERECPFELMHCVSEYNMDDSHANLRMIRALMDRFKCLVGYSGHEQGLIIPCAAVALGATSIEKHITLDHAMYGSDQPASMELTGFEHMVKYIRAIESGMGDGRKGISDEEKVNADKLRYF
ncbi:hypothetical protein LCGC14_1012940 [marine sediment metagenome]|uniref:PseI/NeuA/B-like domain-containing protein n=1 Tax=marine sediment metagenome TaxID=412755 RepID=A0A0F9MZU8_9ZZZZ